MYHGIINNKIRQMVIRGTKVDSDWHDNPNQVKKFFLDFYKDEFKKFLSI